MDTKDARTVIGILLEADGGCPYCAADLLETFATTYPIYSDLCKAMYLDCFHSELKLK